MVVPSQEIGLPDPRRLTSLPLILKTAVFDGSCVDISKLYLQDNLFLVETIEEAKRSQGVRDA